MSLLTEHEVRARAARGRPLNKSAGVALDEHLQIRAGAAEYDIFLSHSFSDQELILGTVLMLEDMGYRVYVDWIQDRQLNRDRVTQETAEVLRQRLLQSRSLFFATTANSGSSKWMPWELGFKDGHNRKSAILPVVQRQADSYSGQEYLGIYPYIDKAPTQGGTKDRLWVHRTPKVYVNFDSWLEGHEPREHS
jgi:hypothetical protein